MLENSYSLSRNRMDQLPYPAKPNRLVFKMRARNVLPHLLRIILFPGPKFRITSLVVAPRVVLLLMMRKHLLLCGETLLVLHAPTNSNIAVSLTWLWISAQCTEQLAILSASTAEV